MQLKYIERVLQNLNSTLEAHGRPTYTFETASEELRETIILIADQLEQLDQRNLKILDILRAEVERLEVLCGD